MAVAAEEIECGAPPARTKPQYGSCWICINEAGDDGDGRDFDVDDGDYWGGGSPNTLIIIYDIKAY